MMPLVNSNGAVLLERGKPHTQRTHTSTLHVRSMSKGMKKTVKPVLMSKDVIVFGDFLITNGDGKTMFQFRTPSEGGVEL
jgi:hypothetical protein